MAQIDDLLNQASEIRDAEQDKENTALRVGQMLIAIVQHIASFVSTDDLQAVLEDYAPLQGALVHWRNSRVVGLASMGADLDNIDGGDWQYTNHAGDIVFDPSGRYLSIVGEQGHYSIFPGVFYVNLHSHHCYVWDATTRAMIEITDSSRPTIIDYRNNPPFDQVAIGESYYFESGSAKKIAIKTSSSGSYPFDPDPKKIYVFKDTCESMIWDATTRSWIAIGKNESGVATSLINQIISNIDLVNGRINTLIDDLAGLAFTGAKTAKTELDWDGTKVTVSLNTSGLSGCKVQETFPKQVLEGSSATITIAPENDSHLMRSASYKIGANGEAHEVTISGNKAVINLSRINENITVYLTASATAKGSFRATISDSRVSGTGATSGIAEGSAWSSKLSLNSTAEEGASITSITATMEGGGSISVNGDTVSTSNVTGNINIVANVAVVGRVSISFPALASGVKITDNNNNNAVVNDGVSSLTLIEDSSISWKIAPVDGFRLTSTPLARMDSGTVVQTILASDNDDGTYNLIINRMRGSIAVTAASMEIIVRHVTNRLLNMTSSNSDTSIEQGESYSTQLSVDSGCTANGDVRVKIGNSYAYNEYDVSQGVENTSGITYENGLLTIPAAAITGDIEIIATAYTGVVKITTTGATTLKYKGGVTFDLVEGLNEVALQDGKGWFSITDKTVVTDIDFGGILFNGDYMRTLQGFTTLSSVRNFVVGGGISSIHDWFNGCSSLSIIDLSYCDVSKCTALNSLFTGSAIQRVDMSMLVFENAVTLSSAFKNTTSLTYIDIRTITNVSNVDRMFSYNSGTAPQCNVYIGDFNASSISTATNVFLNGNVNLHCLSSIPPLIGNTNWLTSGSGLAHIYVPDEAAVTAYSGATGWSAKASIIAVEPTNN